MAARPLGVTIICILGIIAALLAIAGGAGALMLGGLLGIDLVMGLSLVSLVVAIITLISLIWLWQMKKMGWTLVMILEIISLIIMIAGFSLMNTASIVIALIIVVYLYTKRTLFK